MVKSLYLLNQPAAFVVLFFFFVSYLKRTQTFWFTSPIASVIYCSRCKPITFNLKMFQLLGCKSKVFINQRFSDLGFTANEWLKNRYCRKEFRRLSTKHLCKVSRFYLFFPFYLVKNKSKLRQKLPKGDKDFFSKNILNNVYLKNHTSTSIDTICILQATEDENCISCISE